MSPQVSTAVVGEFLRYLAEVAPEDGFIEFRPLLLDGSGRIPRRYNIGLTSFDGWDCVEHGFEGPVTAETLRANSLSLNELRRYFDVEWLRRDPSFAAFEIADIVGRGLARGVPVNAYVGCQPRWCRGGDADSVRAVTALVGDLDVGPKKPYATLDEARAAVRALHGSSGIGPTLEIGSGRGLQVWYMLREPDERLAAWEAISKVLWRLLQSDSLDLARILRLPGTFNYQPRKYGDPLPVLVLDQHPERRCSLDDVADAFGVDIDACTAARVHPPADRDTKPASHFTSPLPSEMPEGVRHVIETLKLVGKDVTSSGGRWKGYRIETCPACGGGDKQEGWKAMVTPSGRLRCYRATCRASRERGLRPEEWLDPDLAVLFLRSPGASTPGPEWVSNLVGYEPSPSVTADEVPAGDAVVEVAPRDPTPEPVGPTEGGSSSVESFFSPARYEATPSAASTGHVADRAEVLRAARAQLTTVIDEAIEWARVDPKRVAVVQGPLGLGKTKIALDALARRGRGAFLAQNHALRAEHQSSYSGPCASRQGFMQLCVLKEHEPETFEQIKKASDRGHDPHRVCGTCPHRKTCPLHQQPRADVVFSVHAAAEMLQADFAGEVFTIDEDPLSELGETLVLDLDELHPLLFQHANPSVNWALTGRRGAIECVTDAMEALQQRLAAEAIKTPTAFRYPRWIFGNELRQELRAAVVRREPGRDPDDSLTGLTRDVQMAAPLPDLTVGDLRSGSWSDHPSPWLDDILLALLRDPKHPALLESVAVVVEIQIMKGEVKGARTRVELRRGRPRGLPNHALVLDGTAQWTIPMLRAASQSCQAVYEGCAEREIRVFGVECPEEPGAVRRYERETKTFDARNCRGRKKSVPRGTGEALGVIQEAIREVGRSGGPATGLRLALVTHKALAEQLRLAWLGKPKSNERVVAELARLRAKGLEDLVVGHFFATRGTNRMKKCHALVVLGDAIPNLGVAEHWARVYGVTVETVVTAIGRAEIEQALGRIRPLEATADDPRWIFHAGRRRVWQAIDPTVEPPGNGPDESPRVKEGPAHPFAVPRGRRRSAVATFVREEAVRQLADVGQVDVRSVADAVRERFGGGGWSIRTVQRHLAEALKGVPGVVLVPGTHGRIIYYQVPFDRPGVARCGVGLAESGGAAASPA